ncbi:MAG: HisA/HisF-related TIM barrel protein, partial [Burkholderiales bacterium]
HLALLRSLKRRAPQKKFYAAGGVRDARDLESLRRAGAYGALLARALHERRLTPGDLAAWACAAETTDAT